MGKGIISVLVVIFIFTLLVTLLVMIGSFVWAIIKTDSPQEKAQKRDECFELGLRPAENEFSQVICVLDN